MDESYLLCLSCNFSFIVATVVPNNLGVYSQHFTTGFSVRNDCIPSRSALRDNIMLHTVCLFKDPKDNPLAYPVICCRNRDKYRLMPLDDAPGVTLHPTSVNNSCLRRQRGRITLAEIYVFIPSINLMRQAKLTAH